MREKRLLCVVTFHAWHWVANVTMILRSQSYFLSFSCNCSFRKQAELKAFRGSWLLPAHVSDASPAAGALVGEGVHYPQLLLLEYLPVYSWLWEFTLLDFTWLLTCLILSRCLEVPLTWSCTMTWAPLLFVLTNAPMKAGTVVLVRLCSYLGK